MGCGFFRQHTTNCHSAMIWPTPGLGSCLPGENRSQVAPGDPARPRRLLDQLYTSDNICQYCVFFSF